MSESLSSSPATSFVVSAAIADDYFNGDLSTVDLILKRARERASASRLGYAATSRPRKPGN